MEAHRKLRKIILYGDLSLDIIDGSAVWLVSMAQVLASTHSEVHLLLKNTPQRSILTESLAQVDDLHIHTPKNNDGEPVTLNSITAWDHIAQVDQQIHADAIIVRGRQVSISVLHHPRLATKLWAYITDLPYPITEATQKDLRELEELASCCRRLFVQTDEARSYLEATVPSAAGKSLLLKPMIPDDFFVDLNSHHAQEEITEPFKLVYAGKFAADWRTLEMCELPKVAAEHGLEIELGVVGDKFHRYPHSNWTELMRAALESTPGVVWHGGLPRRESLEKIARADFGLGWRSPALDSSLELSTKALEYAAAGTPPIINRSVLHETVFGEDYPLFLEADSPSEVLRVMTSAVPDMASIRVQAQSVARKYSFSESAKRLEQYFQRAETFTGERTVLDKHTILIAGHDLKFVGEIAELLDISAEFNTIYDEWPALNRHDEQHSFEQLQRADIVLCEWAGHNAIWYSQRVAGDQKLFIRLHGFEVNAEWLTDIEIENVTRLIVVSDHLKRHVIKRTGWDAHKIVVIPNSLNIPDLARPKLAGHQYRVGFVGMVPFLKRPDRALDVVEELIQHDRRFTLHIRGRFPWEYPHVWKKELEQEAYLSLFARLAAKPLLQEHVVFERFGSDMGSWLRKIGWVLSPSDRESFHLAPAEAMASGAVPLIWHREGAEDIFSPDNVIQNSQEAAAKIISLVDSERYLIESQRAYEHVLQFDAPEVHAQLVDVLKGLEVTEDGPV